MVDITWILKAVDALKDTDLKIKISELVTENLSLKSDNFDLKKKIDAIDEIKTITSQLFVRDKMYFQKKESQEDGPFCTKCWDDEKKLIRVVNRKGMDVFFECPKCKVLIHPNR